MKVLLIGACGYLGPHVVKALASHHQLRITDVKPASAAMKEEFAGHEFRTVDVTVADANCTGMPLFPIFFSKLFILLSLGMVSLPALFILLFLLPRRGAWGDVDSEI